MNQNEINNNYQIDDIKNLTKEDVVTFYTNAVNLAFSCYDFQFLFREQYPSYNEKGIDSINFVRLVMSPQHAKVLNMILEKHIKIYEENYGKIDLREDFLKSLNLLEE